MEKNLNILQGLYKELETKFAKKLQSQQEELLNLSLKVLVETVKALLQTSHLQDEETLRRIFKNIFSEKLFIGEITVRANPEDASLIRSVLEKKDNVVFDLIPDPNLKRGEIEVETEKFFVERKIEELAREFAEEFLQRFAREKENAKKDEEANDRTPDS